MARIVGEGNGRPVIEGTWANKVEPPSAASRSGGSRGGGSGAAAADEAARLSRTGYSFGDYGWCLRFVRTAAGAPAGTPDATTAWNNAKYKHGTSSTPPRGSIVYWTGGSSGHGHVAISDGDGYVWSTDVYRKGKIDRISIAQLNSKWGNLTYKGWAEDVNGKRMTNLGGSGGPDYDKSIRALGGTGSGGTRYTAGPGVELEDEWDRDDFEAALAAAGFGSYLVNSDKELKGKFAQAIQERWTPERFKGEIMGTKWYRNRSESQRKYDTLRKNDPGSWADEVRESTVSVNAAAARMGVRISATRQGEIARAALRNGFTQEELQRAIAAEFDFDPKKSYSGTAGQSLSELRALASSYGVAVGDERLEKQVTGVLRGDQTIDGLKSVYIDQAKRNYSHFAKEFDSGLTLEEIAEPYRQAAARTLEIDPTSFDLRGKTMQQALLKKDEKGNTRALALWEFEEALKNDERWLQTNNARDSLMTMGRGLLSSFGLAV